MKVKSKSDLSDNSEDNDSTEDENAVSKHGEPTLFDDQESMLGNSDPRQQLDTELLRDPDSDNEIDDGSP